MYNTLFKRNWSTVNNIILVFFGKLYISPRERKKTLSLEILIVIHIWHTSGDFICARVHIQVLYQVDTREFIDNHSPDDWSASGKITFV